MQVPAAATHDALQPPACQALAQVSARLGQDALLVQAAGGNTSVKDGDTLWVKASGLWLRDALQRPCFVPVRLSQVRERIAQGLADPVSGTLIDSLAPAGLRPSIETTLHALMPHAVVLHVHAVDAIAWAVRPDRSDALKHRLNGLAWAEVPYVRPGLPLTRAVAELTAQRPVDVLLMANHGLVVGGTDLPSAEALLRDVVQRLACQVRAAPAPALAQLQSLAAGTDWRLPNELEPHAIATDALNLRRARQGVLYPDHVVFLGSDLATGEAALRSAEPAPCVALPGLGLLVHPSLSEAGLAMLRCWAEVLQRLPVEVEPQYLDPAEVQGLANWDAEKFRRQLAR